MNLFCLLSDVHRRHKRAQAGVGDVSDYTLEYALKCIFCFVIFLLPVFRDALRKLYPIVNK